MTPHTVTYSNVIYVNSLTYISNKNTSFFVTKGMRSRSSKGKSSVWVISCEWPPTFLALYATAPEERFNKRSWTTVSKLKSQGECPGCCIWQFRSENGLKKATPIGHPGLESDTRLPLNQVWGLQWAIFTFTLLRKCSCWIAAKTFNNLSHSIRLWRRSPLWPLKL